MDNQWSLAFLAVLVAAIVILYILDVGIVIERESGDTWTFGRRFQAIMLCLVIAGFCIAAWLGDKEKSGPDNHNCGGDVQAADPGPGVTHTTSEGR